MVRSFMVVRVGTELDQQLSRRVYTASYEQSLRHGGSNAGSAAA